LVERAEKVEDTKVLGRDLLDWFRKVLRNFILKKLPGVIWANKVYHLRFLAHLHELSRRKLDWMSVDQTASECVSRDQSQMRFCAKPQPFLQVSRQAYQILAVWGFRECKLLVVPSSRLDLVFLRVWGFPEGGKDVIGPVRSASSSGDVVGPRVAQPSATHVGPSVVEPLSPFVSGRGDSGVTFSPPRRSLVAEDPEFVFEGLGYHYGRFCKNSGGEGQLSV